MIPKISAVSRPDTLLWCKESALRFTAPRAIADDVAGLAESGDYVHEQALQQNRYIPRSVDRRLKFLNMYEALSTEEKARFDALACSLPARPVLPDLDEFDRFQRHKMKRLDQIRRNIEALDLDVGHAPRLQSREAPPAATKETDKHFKVLGDYSFNLAAQVNGVLRLRAGVFTEHKELESIAEACDSIIPGIDNALLHLRDLGHGYSGVSFRGISKENATKINLGSLQVGDILRDPAYVSTSTDMLKAKEKFAKDGGTMIHIIGRSGVRIETHSIADAEGEQEVLYPRNTAFRVVKSESHPSKILVLREIAHGEGCDASIETGDKLAPELVPRNQEKSTKQILHDVTFPAVDAKAFDYPHHKGSNDGGFYELASGKKGYAKFYQDPDQAKIEVLANALYRRAVSVIATPESRTLSIDGRPAIFSPLVEGNYVTREQMAQDRDFMNGFAMDAILANHDVIGLNQDNVIAWHGVSLYRIDNGGSLMFRAMGDKKEIANNAVPELQSMRNPNNAAGKVFSGLSDQDVALQIYTLSEELHPNAVRMLVRESGFVGAQAHSITETLNGRIAAAVKWAKNVPKSEVPPSNENHVQESPIEPLRNTTEQLENIDTTPFIADELPKPKPQAPVQTPSDLTRSGESAAVSPVAQTSGKNGLSTSTKVIIGTLAAGGTIAAGYGVYQLTQRSSQQGAAGGSRLA